MKKRQGSRTIRVYRSYNFTDKNPIVDRLRTRMQDIGLDCRELAAATGLSLSCVRGIFEGGTRDPLHSTVARMAIAMNRPDMLLVPNVRAAAASKKTEASHG